MIDLSTTPMRRQFEFLTRNGADPSIFLRQVSISFGEKIHPDIVRRAWDVVAAATPVLREAVSGSDDAEGGAATGVWKTLDWREKDPDSLGNEWSGLLASDATEAFSTAPMQRVQLILLPNGTIHVLWTSDARELDYSSLAGTLIRWFAACDLLVSAQAVEWPQDPDPAAFIAKLADRPLSADQDFWKSHLSGFESPLQPVLFPLPSTDLAPRGSREAVTFTFERSERISLGEAAEAMDLSLSSIGRAAWVFLLGEVCGAQEFLLTEPIEADASSVLAQTAGRFEAWLPRRVVIPTSGSLSEFGKSSEEWELQSGRYFDFDAIASAAGLKPDDIIPSAAFIFRDGTLNDTLRRALPRWMAADVCVYEKATHPLTLLWTDTDRPVIEIGYDPGKLSEGAVRLLLQRWVLLVRKFVEEPETLLSQLSLLLPGESGDVRGVDRTSAARSLVPQCIHEAFNDLAVERADHSAIELGVETIPYSKLTSQSNQLARYLQKNGISSGDAIGVAMSRSPFWVIALLGVWKAGGKVILLNTNSEENAPSRIELKAVIQDTTTAATVTVADGVKRITIDSGWGAISGEKTRALSVTTQPDAPALICRSSEVCEIWNTLTHEQILAAAMATSEVLGMSEADRLLQFAPVDLPASVEEMLAVFLTGGTLVLRPEDVLSTRTAFHEFVMDARITTLVLPAAFWGQWLHYLTELSATASPLLRVVAVAGWRILPSQITEWEKVATNVALIHVSPGFGLLGLGFMSENIPLGSLYVPLHARIVNTAGIELPAGFCGNLECAIASTSNLDAELNFKQLGRTAFRTEDGRFLAREWVDAELANFSPRHALSAAEWIASQHPGVSTVVAAMREFDGESQLCVWIVPQDTMRGEPLDFRSFLSKHLPNHLTPSRVGCLQRLPLTRTCEVDYSALPEPNADVPEFSNKHERGTDEEELLRNVLGKVLGGRVLRLDEMIRDGKARSQVAESMCDAVSQSGFSAEMTDFTVPFSIRSLLRNIRSRRSLTESGWVPLKPLRMSGSLPPLVLIHDFSGSSRVCESLAAALGEDQPCYAITARGLAEPSMAHTSVEEMAKAYVEAIKVMDPEGPHGIIGIGFGGLVAFECAKILNAEGITPRMLAVLRTEPPVTSGAVRGLRVFSRNLLKTFRGNRADANSSSRSGRAGGANPIFEANQEAATKYAPDGEASFAMHAFVPEQEFSSFRDVQSGWNSVCSGVNFYQVPCTAQELLEEPAVTAVGEAILKLIQSGNIIDDSDDDGDSEEEAE